MTRRTQTLVVCAAICVAMFAFAFVAAPKSCEWGNDAYFWSGVAALAALLVLPFVFRAGESLPSRAGLALGLGVFGGGVWFAGLFAANFRIICRLF